MLVFCFFVFFVCLFHREREREGQEVERQAATGEGGDKMKEGREVGEKRRRTESGYRNGPLKYTIRSDNEPFIHIYIFIFMSLFPTHDLFCQSLTDYFFLPHKLHFQLNFLLFFCFCGASREEGGKCSVC